METLLKIQGYYHKTIFDCFIESFCKVLTSDFIYIKKNELGIISIIGEVNNW